MCGINGIIGFEDSQVATKKVATMNKTLSHRGPNDEGVFTEAGVCLGHKRLSIIDLSQAGKQPMESDDGRYVLSFNGEIYNYREVRKELKNVSFKTNTDTEVLIEAWAKWGEQSIPKLNGMFAFAVWDKQEQQLTLVRDRLGIKPLYYFHQNSQLIFSSELRSLLSSGLVPKKMDESSLVDYLRYQTVHAPNTIIKNVKMLMPGSILQYKKGETSISKYWDVNEIKESNNEESYSSVKAKTKEMLCQSIEKRLVADVPFGAFLSGGIDSSAVVAIMSEVRERQVKTFSVVFDEKEYSEETYSNLIAQKFNTDHQPIRLTPNDFLEDLPNALSAMDHPSGDGPNTYTVSRVTKQAGITMALSGLGGDEVFCGYSIFSQALQLKNKQWLKNMPLKKVGAELLKSMKPGVATDKLAQMLTATDLSFEQVYPYFRQVLQEETIARLLTTSQLPNNKVAELTKTLQNRDNHLLSKVSKAEMSTYMQNVLLRDTDQMSMAHALEVRVPFLDHTLVEYVLSLPDIHKDSKQPKQLLIDSLAGLLPEEIWNRKKMGFTFPWASWMKNELKEFCEENIIQLSQRTYFNEKEVMKLWEDFLKGNPKVTWARLWMLVVLEDWLARNEVE